jgi:hypothetical protein
MLTERGSDRDFVKILDFGLSRPMTADAAGAITHSGQIFGTPEYMAPEQWHGRPCDARTDIYALGMTAYETITATLPFEGKPLELMLKHLEAPPPPPSTRVPGLLPSLDAFVVRCLQKSPADRFQTMPEVLAALGEIWRGLPPKHAQTTYASTLAAPPPPREDEIPDVTVYQTSHIDVAWDGPSLCEELRRLHQQRGRRLGELLSALYGDDVPAEVRELRSAVDARDGELDRIVSEVRSLQTRMEETHRTAREEEGELRAQLIDASLATDESETDRPPPPHTAAGRDATVHDEAPGTRLRQVERRIAALDRRRSRQWLELHAELTARITQLGAIEAELAPKLARLGGTLKAAVGSRPALRPLLVDFQKIDGAMAAYHALLGALEEVA